MMCILVVKAKGWRPAVCTQLPGCPVGGSNNNLLWKDRQRPGKAVVMRAFKVEQQLSSHASRGC